ncbi:MAG: hypothetical protein K2N34_08565 [Lachnospiraceae bacterium]|nr:hypothetical protein [Lachnospiraceae bacterium]
MTYEQYRSIYIIALILTIFFLVSALALFIILKIPKVIGNLSGSSERKAVKVIRERNGGIGNYTALGPKTVTEKIATKTFHSVENHTQETIMLENGETVTSMLNQNDNETTVLNQQEEFESDFTIEYDITFIHTNIIIE